MAKDTKDQVENKAQVEQNNDEPLMTTSTSPESGFGDSSTPEQELIDANSQFEQVKKSESEFVMTSHEFDQRHVQAEKELNRVNSPNGFDFKAGVKNGKRYFNVKGFSDPRQVYRAASMERRSPKDGRKKETLYFLGANYDAMYNLNDERQLTVNAWVEIEQEDGSKSWEKTPISKSNIKDLTTVPMDEGKRVFHAITQQGKNPSE